MDAETVQIIELRQVWLFSNYKYTPDIQEGGRKHGHGRQKRIPNWIYRDEIYEGWWKTHWMRLNSMLDIAKGTISELKDLAIETLQIKT